tara:strand:+ start:82 stop:234 length:153 start_codon:yes stop_codon:yes gene_type:complete
MIETVNERFMTVKEYAGQNNVSVQSVYQSIKRGAIEVKKIGSLILVKIPK